MLLNYFGYIFVHLKQKAHLRPELSMKFLSTLGPNPNPTQKARPDLQLWLGEILVEQIIEFELRRLGHSGRTYTPTTGYFHDKTKISKTILRMDYYLMLKYCRKQ